jgi:hypothetical protein
MNLRVRTVIPDIVPTGGTALLEGRRGVRASVAPQLGFASPGRCAQSRQAWRWTLWCVSRAHTTHCAHARAFGRPFALVCTPLTPLSPLPWAQAFHLVGELRGHSEDVRAVALAGPHGVATTSRDKTLRTWPVDGAAQLRGEGTVFVGHTDFVGPVVWAPPGLLPVAPEGALVTGSRDTTLLIWHPTAAVTLQRLAGHCLQVRMGQ